MQNFVTLGQPLLGEKYVARTNTNMYQPSPTLNILIVTRLCILLLRVGAYTDTAQNVGK